MKHKIKVNGQIVEVSEGDKVVASFGVEVKAVDKENHTLTMVCSTEDIDRHGDTVKQDGWDLRPFKKNPVILNSHNYFDATEVIAKGIKPRIEGKGKKAKLVMEWKFAVEENEKAKTIFDLYAGGFLHASSVGFIPRKFGEREDGGRDWFTIVEAELLEVSAVSVPANAAATLAKSIGASVKDVAEAIGIEDEDGEPVNPEDIEEVEETEEVETPEEETTEEAEEETTEEAEETTEEGDEGEEEETTEPEEEGDDIPEHEDMSGKNVKPKLTRNQKVLKAIHNIEADKKKTLKAARVSIEKMIDVSGLKSLDEKTQRKVKNRKVHQALRRLSKTI
jgi:uncharacterized protein